MTESSASTASPTTTSPVQARPKVGVGVMMFRDGKVLIGKRRGSHGSATYGWCGGHVEFGETLEEAARREVEEETGMVARELRFLCVSNIVNYDKHYVDVEFICTDFSGEPEVREADRVDSWTWYSIDELPKPLFAAVELAINSYTNGIVYNS
jgi:8-oxo-dGTP diphosphatase